MLPRLEHVAVHPLARTEQVGRRENGLDGGVQRRTVEVVRSGVLDRDRLAARTALVLDCEHGVDGKHSIAQKAAVMAARALHCNFCCDTNALIILSEA